MIRRLFVFGCRETGYGWFATSGPSIVVDSASPSAGVGIAAAIDAGLLEFARLEILGVVDVVLPGRTAITALLVPDGAVWARHEVPS